MKALSRRWLRWFAGASIGSLGFVALIGFMHTDLGRPLLHLFAKAAGCPVDLEGANPAKVEAYRVERLRERSGAAEARSPAALDFELGRSTRAEVTHWAERTGARCTETRRGSVLHCSLGATPKTLAIEDLHLQFDAEHRLVAVDLFRAESCAEDAVVHVNAVNGALTERVGPATSRQGELDAEFLQKPYRRAAFEYRYKDYRATVSATNLNARGIRVREQYQWAPPLNPTPPS